MTPSGILALPVSSGNYASAWRKTPWRTGSWTPAKERHTANESGGVEHVQDLTGDDRDMGAVSQPIDSLAQAPVELLT